MGSSPDAELIRILVSMRLQGYMELIKGDYTVEERIRLGKRDRHPCGCRNDGVN